MVAGASETATRLRVKSSDATSKQAALNALLSEHRRALQCLLGRQGACITVLLLNVHTLPFFWKLFMQL